MTGIEAATVLGTVALGAAKRFGEISIGVAWENISRLLSIKTELKRPNGMEAAAEAHIKASYERCTKIKTLISRDKPVDLLSIYVDVRFKHKNDILLSPLKFRTEPLGLNAR